MDQSFCQGGGGGGVIEHPPGCRPAMVITELCCLSKSRTIPLNVLRLTCAVLYYAVFLISLFYYQCRSVEEIN